MEAAARAKGLSLQIFNASTVREIDAAFAMLVRERADALVCTENLIRIDYVTESPKRQRR